jgi:hypothetical protein
MNSRRRTSKSLQSVPKTTPPTIPQQFPIKESSFGSVVKQGFGWGLGNSIAHSLMNTVSNSLIVSDPVPKVELDSKQLAYKQCMVDFDDKESCKHLLK